MGLKRRFTLRDVPLRLTAGAFIVNSGLSKRNPSPEMAGALHGMATQTYPHFKRLEPEQFTKLLSTSELVVGGALLNPLVPNAVAGAALTGFSAALLGLYLRTPGMRQAGSLRPTQEGTALAKDTWLLGIGLALLLDGLLYRD
jgi:hypothetical protein